MRSFLKCLTPLCLIILLLAAPAIAAADFDAGVARVKITPTTPIRMAGYASRTSESLGVELDLYARALALRDPAGHRAVIVTTELIGLSGAVAGEVFARAEKQFGLKRAEMLITCSHTHSGPVIRANLEAMYDMNPAEKDHMRAYAAQLVDNLVSAIGAALKDLSPAKLEVGHGEASIATNRRQPSATGVKLGCQPKRPHRSRRPHPESHRPRRQTARGLLRLRLPQHHHRRHRRGTRFLQDQRRLRRLRPGRTRGPLPRHRRHVHHPLRCRSEPQPARRAGDFETARQDPGRRNRPRPGHAAPPAQPAAQHDLRNHQARFRRPHPPDLRR